MSWPIIVLGLFSIAIWTSAAGGPQLFVIIPNLMHFDVQENVTVKYFGGGNSARVNVLISDYPDRSNTWSAKSVMVQPNETTVIRMITSESDHPAGSLATEKSVYVKVECAALRFRREVVVLLTGTKGYLFLQTDKPIYSPKQLVYIRAISLNPEMRPSDANFTIDVINPKNTTFNRFHGKAVKGFYTCTVRIPDITIFGNWMVKASYANRFEAKELATKVFFEVQEYVLPSFSIKIESPNFIISTDDEIEVTVRARYVYKEDVKGRLTILFTLSKKDGTNQLVDIKTLDFNGQITVVLSKDKFSQWFPGIVGSRLVVEAAVTETASGNQEKNIDSTAVFVNSPYVISFDRTTKYVKPGLPYSLKVQVKYPNGKVSSGVKILVSATVKEEGSTDRGGISRDNDHEQDYRTNAEGMKSVIIDVPRKAVDVKVKVKTNDTNFDLGVQAIKEITLIPQQSRRNMFISIQLLDAPDRLPVRPPY